MFTYKWSCACGASGMFALLGPDGEVPPGDVQADALQARLALEHPDCRQDLTITMGMQ